MKIDVLTKSLQFIKYDNEFIGTHLLFCTRMTVAKRAAHIADVCYFNVDSGVHVGVLLAYADELLQLIYYHKALTKSRKILTFRRCVLKDSF